MTLSKPSGGILPSAIAPVTRGISSGSVVGSVVIGVVAAAAVAVSPTGADNGAVALAATGGGGGTKGAGKAAPLSGSTPMPINFCASAASAAFITALPISPAAGTAITARNSASMRATKASSFRPLRLRQVPSALIPLLEL